MGRSRSHVYDGNAGDHADHPKEARRQLRIRQERGACRRALTGACFAATITHPMDTIKTCMQGDLARAKYTDVSSTWKALANEYGVVQGLFKGLTFRIALISTTFFLVNNFKGFLVPAMFPHVVKKEAKKNGT